MTGPDFNCFFTVGKSWLLGGSRQHNIQFLVLRSYKDFNPKIDTIIL